MKYKYVLLIIITLVTSKLCFAIENDTSVIRLKSGTRLRGIITSRTDATFKMSVVGIGEQEFPWSDVTFMSSSAVYDSLNASRSFIVVPSPEKEQTWFDKNFSVDFLTGGTFQYERGLGLGIRGRVTIGDHFTVGGLTILHFGNFVLNSDYGNGVFVSWGPEIGATYRTGAFIVDPLFSFGQSTIRTAPNSITSPTESKFYMSPGIAFRVDCGTLKFGLQYRYFIISSLNMSAVYFSVGK
jgi:hypothetical protein